MNVPYDTQEYIAELIRDKGKWIKLVDNMPQVIEINDWTIHKPETRNGLVPCFKTIDDKYFPITAMYIGKLLHEHELIGKHVKFSITRYNSTNKDLVSADIENVSFL